MEIKALRPICFNREESFLALRGNAKVGVPAEGGFRRRLLRLTSSNDGEWQQFACFCIWL